MTVRLEAGPFATEREEADWWFNNQDLIADLFEQKYGPVQPSFVALDVDGEDADLLRQRAAAEGIEPHVYATRLIHEALHG